MWNQPDINTDPLWDIRLEMLKNFMFAYIGQKFTEVVQAPDRTAAITKALKNNDMLQEHIDNEVVKVLGATQWTENEQII
jgi:hypothetical protein